MTTLTLELNEGKVIRYISDFISNNVVRLEKLPGEFNLNDPYLKEISGDTSKGWNLLTEISSNHYTLEEKGFRYYSDFKKWKIYTRNDNKEIIAYRKTKSLFEAFVGRVDAGEYNDIACWGRKGKDVKVCNVFKVQQDNNIEKIVHQLTDAGARVTRELVKK